MACPNYLSVREAVATAVLHIVQNVGHAVVYVLGRVAETFGKELVFLCTLLQVHLYRFLKMVSFLSISSNFCWVVIQIKYVAVLHFGR